MSGGVTGRSADPADRVLRFRSSERFLHWAIAVPFVLCAASAIVLVLVYNPAPQRPLRALVSWIHRISGACFLTAPLLVALRHRREAGTYWRNVREAFHWKRDDVRWLMLQGPTALGRKTELPEAGKFNAGQKLNFMMVVSTWPLFALTGALIWFSDLAFVSWVFHFLTAAVALPLVTGHIYMALVNPSTRKGLSGMLSGFVDRHWLAHHHPRWYRETFGTASAAAPALSAPRPVAAQLPALQPPAARPPAVQAGPVTRQPQRPAPALPRVVRSVPPAQAGRNAAALPLSPAPAPGSPRAAQPSSPPRVAASSVPLPVSARRAASVPLSPLTAAVAPRAVVPSATTPLAGPPAPVVPRSSPSIAEESRATPPRAPSPHAGRPGGTVPESLQPEAAPARMVGPVAEEAAGVSPSAPVAPSSPNDAAPPRVVAPAAPRVAAPASTPLRGGATPDPAAQPEGRPASVAELEMSAAVTSMGLPFPARGASPSRPEPGAKVVAFQKVAPSFQRPTAAEDADPMARPARILCSACDSEHEVESWGVLFDRFFTTSSIPCPGCGVEMRTIQPVLTDPDLLEPILSRLEGRGAEGGAERRTQAPGIPATPARVIRSVSR